MSEPCKVVDTFNASYLPEATPYHLVNFHTEVISACTENRAANAERKVIKAVLVGDIYVAKTALLERFCHGSWETKSATIGVSFNCVNFCVLTVPVVLQIWDISATDRMRHIRNSYCRAADIIIAVFDLTNEQSLENTVRRMEEACSHAKEPAKFLVGTRKDLLDPAAYNEIEKKAVEYSHFMEAEFWPTSPKTNENIQDFFIRALCVSFNNSVLRELHSDKSANKQVDGSTVHI